MPHTIEVKDCGYETAIGLRDMMRLIEDRMGAEFRSAFEEMISEEHSEEVEEDHQRELDQIRDYYHGVILELREESEQLAELIRAPRLDRKKISSAAGRIGVITRREL